MDTSSLYDDDNARNNGDEAMTEMSRHQETTTTMTSPMGEFSGVEAFLVGISPMYWAHVPMSILDIHNLQLINGIHCMILQNNKNSRDSNNNAAAASLVAVSKCSLMGMVVLVEQRPGSILFVLDDGTALIDCLLWMDKDIFELPFLLMGEDTTPRRRHGVVEEECPQVGQMVRVLGRIECVSVQDVVVAATSTWGKHCETRHCIREIHVTLVEPIPVSSQAQPHSLNAESMHWLEYSHRFGMTTTTADSNNNDKQSSNNKPAIMMKMMNASYILHHFLGPDIAQQVSRRESLPSAHDKMASWKLFGVTCKCSSATLKYKDELLYCHCQATALVNNNSNNKANNTDHAALFDDTDAGFVYRDALLNRLLELQQQEQQQSENDSSSNDDNKKQQQPLQFQYKTVATDSQLMALLDSRMEIKTSSTMATSLTLQQQQQQQHRRSRVIQKTFAALRKDGILALLSIEADVYLLISRSRVLEPYIRRMTMTQQQKGGSTISRCPDYLSNVPKARLEFVRRTMSI